jgi:nucleoside-triphosphatase
MSHPRVEIYSDIFDTYGADIVASSGSRGLIILDELGVLEDHSPVFRRAVMDKLDGAVPALGVLKQADGDFLAELRSRSDIEIILLTRENREFAPCWLAERFCQRYD